MTGRGKERKEERKEEKQKQGRKEGNKVVRSERKERNAVKAGRKE